MENERIKLTTDILIKDYGFVKIETPKNRCGDCFIDPKYGEGQFAYGIKLIDPKQDGGIGFGYFTLSDDFAYEFTIKWVDELEVFYKLKHKKEIQNRRETISNQLKLT